MQVVFLTLKGQTKCWLETFPPNLIFTWFQFAHEFLDTLKDYDSIKLCSELQALQRKKCESSEDFSIRLSHIFFKFHIINSPSESDLLNIDFNSQVPLIQQNQDVCEKDDNSVIFQETSSSIIDSDTFISSTQPLGENIEVEEVPTSSDHYSPLEGEIHNSFIQNIEPININESNEEEHIHDKFIRTDREVDCINEQQDSDSIIAKLDQD